MSDGKDASFQVPFKLNERKTKFGKLKGKPRPRKTRFANLTAFFKLSSIRMRFAVNSGGRHGGSVTWRRPAELSSSRPSSSVCQSVLTTERKPLILVSVKLYTEHTHTHTHTQR